MQREFEKLMLLRSLFRFVLPNSLVSDIEKSSRIIKNTHRMSKAQTNNLSHIDFEKGVLYGLLKQIRYSNPESTNSEAPQFTDVWCCTLKPQQTKSFIKFIKEWISPYETRDFTHLKRLQKIGTGKDFYLKGIMCGTALYPQKSDLLEYIREYADPDMREITSENIIKTEVPCNSPSTRELALEWSDLYWPISWKGNPNFQFLKETNFDITKEKQMIKNLLKELEVSCKTSSTKNTIPVATIVVNPETDQIIASSSDCRSEHPLHHSVMAAIEKVAQREKARRKELEINEEESGYLLNGLVVYTTHEPCVMCSMGLVHSRIKRIVFLRPMESGGLESNYQMGDRSDLNWKFETWRWLDKEDLHALDVIEKKYKPLHRLNI